MSEILKDILKSSSYTFDASAQTVTFTDSYTIQEIALIVNVTDGIIIYQPLCSGTVGTLTGRVLTLVYDTTSMSDSDELKIYTQVQKVLVGSNQDETKVQDRYTGELTYQTELLEKILEELITLNN